MTKLDTNVFKVIPTMKLFLAALQYLLLAAAARVAIPNSDILNKFSTK